MRAVGQSGGQSTDGEAAAVGVTAQWPERGRGSRMMGRSTVAGVLAGALQLNGRARAAAAAALTGWCHPPQVQGFLRPQQHPLGHSLPGVCAAAAAPSPLWRRDPPRSSSAGSLLTAQSLCGRRGQGVGPCKPQGGGEHPTAATAPPPPPPPPALAAQLQPQPGSVQRVVQVAAPCSCSTCTADCAAHARGRSMVCRPCHAHSSSARGLTCACTCTHACTQPHTHLPTPHT